MAAPDMAELMVIVCAGVYLPEAGLKAGAVTVEVSAALVASTRRAAGPGVIVPF